jgi:hypothetical protein
MIGGVYLKFLIQKVRRNRKIMSGIGRRLEFLFGSRPNAGFTHDSGNTIFPAPDAVIDKIPMNSGCTVYTVACCM